MRRDTIIVGLKSQDYTVTRQQPFSINVTGGSAFERGMSISLCLVTSCPTSAMRNARVYTRLGFSDYQKLWVLFTVLNVEARKVVRGELTFDKEISFLANRGNIKFNILLLRNSFTASFNILSIRDGLKLVGVIYSLSFEHQTSALVNWDSNRCFI